MQNVIDKILHTSGVSKTQLSKDLGISKSYVLNVINGVKKCSRSMYEKLRILSYVPNSLQTELDTAYYGELFGKEKYKQIIHFVNLIEHFEDDFLESKTMLVRTDFVDEILSKKENIHTINNKTEMLEFAICIAKKCVNESSSFFYTNYKFSQKDLDKLLFTVFRDRDYTNEINFKHIVNINSTSQLETLDIFHHALKWGRILFETKHSTEFSGNATNLFPYYIISPFGILLFDDKCERGMILASSSAVEYYQSVFLETEQKFTPTCVVVNDEVSCLGQTDLFSGMNTAKTSYGGLACFGPYCDEEILNNIKYDTPQNDILTQMFLTHYGTLYSTPQKEYLSESAYWDFVEDGDIHCVTDRYVNKCSPSDRIHLLQNIIEGNKKDGVMTIKLFDESKIKIPTNFIIDCFENYSVITSLFIKEPCMNYTKPYAVSLMINYAEMYWFKELSENMCSYFEERKLMLSDEACINSFERMISKCKAM